MCSYCAHTALSLRSKRAQKERSMSAVGAQKSAVGAHTGLIAGNWTNCSPTALLLRSLHVTKGLGHMVVNWVTRVKSHD